MSNQELIVVKQLPIIEEQLKTLSEEIDKKVSDATALVCTEETIKQVKGTRAELNKQFAELEEQRKLVKNQVMNPYQKFEEIYKECVSDKFKKADQDLKKKIDVVENEVKKNKEDELKEYFNEYKTFKNIDFITFEQANIKVGLSDSKVSLHKQAQAFVDKVADDLNLINTQDHKAEILVEYKQNLNVSQAITTVTNRFKAIEEEKKKQEELSPKDKELINDFVDRAKQRDEALQAPKAEQMAEDILTLKFTVKGTRTKLKALKQFLEDGGYDYE